MVPGHIRATGLLCKRGFGGERRTFSRNPKNFSDTPKKVCYPALRYRAAPEDSRVR